MKKISIISYPSNHSYLLSLIEHASRYELYLWGRFRILDLILSMALNISAENIVLFEPDYTEFLEVFASSDLTVEQIPPITIKKLGQSHKYSVLLNSLQELDSEYCLFINGDNPIVGDLKENINSVMEKDLPFSIIKLSFNDEPEYTTRLLLIKRENIISLLQSQFKEINSFSNFFENLIDSISKHEKAHQSQLSGYFHLVNNLVDYYNVNMDIIYNLEALYDLFKKIPVGNIIAPLKGEGTIKRTGQVFNSIIADNCQIEGQVEKSILFPNVAVQKNTKITNSIILPNTIIAKGCTITRTIIDETFEMATKKTTLPSFSEKPTIGDGCQIGSENTEAKNYIYPDAAFNGITLIGVNCRLPKNMTIGAACYVSGNSYDAKLKKNGIINDSESI